MLTRSKSSMAGKKQKRSSTTSSNNNLQERDRHSRHRSRSSTSSRSSSRSSSSRLKSERIDTRLSRSQIRRIADLVSKNVFKLFICSKHQRLMRKACKENKLQTCCMSNHIANSVVQLQQQQKQKHQQTTKQGQKSEQSIISTPRSRTPHGFIKMINSSWLNLMKKSPTAAISNKSSSSKTKHQKKSLTKQIIKSKLQSILDKRVMIEKSPEHKSPQMKEKEAIQQSSKSLVVNDSIGEANVKSLAISDSTVAKCEQQDKIADEKSPVVEKILTIDPTKELLKKNSELKLPSSEEGVGGSSSGVVEPQIEKEQQNLIKIENEIPNEKTKELAVASSEIINDEPKTKSSIKSKIIENDSIQKSRDSVLPTPRLSPEIKMDEKKPVINSTIEKPIESTMEKELMTLPKNLNDPDNTSSANKMMVSISIDKDDKSKVIENHSTLKKINDINENDGSSLKSKMINHIKTTTTTNTPIKPKTVASTVVSKSIMQSPLSTRKTKSLMMNKVKSSDNKTLASITKTRNKQLRNSAASSNRLTAIPSPMKKSLMITNGSKKVDANNKKITSILSKKQAPQSSSLSKNLNDNNPKIRSPELLTFSPGLVTPDSSCMMSHELEDAPSSKINSQTDSSSLHQQNDSSSSAPSSEEVNCQLIEKSQQNPLTTNQ
ncbi:hypothetical protein HUG17_8426 [Dermatophagoides farinae]|uniref:Uncharacterized protein n=1 Tax=Dermatophagoides farinae TaxID=6954 RepID=A0A9D4SGE5_DERFA|nr:putative neugrin-like protein DDB_G0288135 [Dermatophagoides farinae]KAH7640957.1 hypothetical protein HUG17_8426 [Dermatophagoides farinae]